MEIEEDPCEFQLPDFKCKFIQNLAHVDYTKLFISFQDVKGI
jgi:hypothetical protein